MHVPGSSVLKLWCIIWWNSCWRYVDMTIRWDTKHIQRLSKCKTEVQAVISQVISRLSFWKSVDPMVSRTAPGEARRICNGSLNKLKTQSYAMLHDATRHRTMLERLGRISAKNRVQDDLDRRRQAIWRSGVARYGEIWRDMARWSLATCVSTVSTYFGSYQEILRLLALQMVRFVSLSIQIALHITESDQSPVPDSVLQAREH